jgi:hypothetical protein
MQITFDGAEDLAAKLLQLSQAMANDGPAFAEAVEPKEVIARRGDDE